MPTITSVKVRRFILVEGDSISVEDLPTVERLQLFDEDGNPLATLGGSGSMTFRTSHGFVIGGEITAALNVPDFHFVKADSQTSKLVSITARIESGTSVDVSVRRNASAVGSAKTVTSTKQSFAYDQELSNGDALDLAFANPVGTPTDLGVTLVIEHTVTS